MTFDHDLERPRLGLALGAGAARGWSHIGVLRVLEANGIRPDIVCGASIGSVVAGCYLAGKLDLLESWARGLNRLRMLSYLDVQMRQSGLIGGEKLVAELRRHLGDIDCRDLPGEFAAVATDLATGHEVWLDRGPLADALRASMALPGMFSPARWHDRWLVDGALVNPVPVSACLAKGARLVIAVNLNADIIGKLRPPGQNYQRVAGFDLLEAVEQQKDSGRGGLVGSLSGLARRLFRREPNTPSLFGVMVSSLNIMQDRIARSRLAGDPPDIHIAPRIGHIGLAEFDRADELIDLGAKAATAALPDIRQALALFGIPIGANGDPASAPGLPPAAPEATPTPTGKRRLRRKQKGPPPS